MRGYFFGIFFGNLSRLRPERWKTSLNAISCDPVAWEFRKNFLNNFFRISQKLASAFQNPFINERKLIPTNVIIISMFFREYSSLKNTLIRCVWFYFESIRHSEYYSFFFAKTKDINSLQNMFFYLFKSILQTVETNQKLATDLNVNIIVRK